MRRFSPLIALAATLLIAGCDPTPPSPTTAPSGATSGPTVDFVGNSSCPTDNTTSYNSGHAPATNGTGAPVGQAIPEMPHNHVAPPTTVTYMHDPPTSGCHYSIPSGGGQSAPVTPGGYDQAVDPEYWVHNLEHGYIAVLYNCPSGCATEFNQLHSWYKSLAPDPQLQSSCPSAYGLSAPYAKVIVVPDTTMSVKFAVVSWDWYDGMSKGLDINEVQRFYDNHVDQGPEQSNGVSPC